MKRLLLLVFSLLVLLPAGAYAGVDTLAVPDIQDTAKYIAYLNNQSARLMAEGAGEQAARYAGQALELARLTGNDDEAAYALFYLGNAYSGKGEDKKALSSFIRSLKRKKTMQNLQLAEKLYYSMAMVCARIKKYPQALKYFHKASQLHNRQEDEEEASGLVADDDDHDDDDNLPTDPRQLLNQDSLGRFRLSAPALYYGANELVIDNDTILLDHDLPQSRKVAKLKARDIIQPFHDHKKALAYGLLLHTKQPVSGERKAFTGINNVGHMFITLIKFNADSGYVSRTFGFYPEKDNLLAATPFRPSSTSVFKDDGAHDWDEMVGKFISRKRFRKILRMVKQYSKSKYNLNRNNCTDFGLCVAAIAGISIAETKGSWPLGSGNNPANAGQSIREGKVEDTDTQLKSSPLLILNNLSP